MAKERNASVIAQLELVALLVNQPEGNRPSLFDITNAVYDMAKLAKVLHKRYEASCGYQWACAGKYERRTANIEAQVKALAESIGVEYERQGDPRGWPVIIKFNGHESRLG